jgi:hypothetical protein
MNSSVIEYADGSKEWHANGVRHRLDGPAVVWPTGTKSWYVNGQLHRLDGPAFEWSDGVNSWYIDGKRYSEQEFPKAVVMFLLNCNEETVDVVLELLKYCL